MNHLRLTVLFAFALGGAFAQVQTTCEDECTELFAPNVITPNGDQFNDFFAFSLAEGSCFCAVEEVLLVIYNRWGTEVYCYQGSDLFNVAWSGESGGSALSESCYYYRAEVIFQAGQIRTLKGWLKIVRETKF